MIAYMTGSELRNWYRIPRGMYPTGPMAESDLLAFHHVTYPNATPSTWYRDPNGFWYRTNGEGDVLTFTWQGERAALPWDEWQAESAQVLAEAQRRRS